MLREKAAREQLTQLNGNGHADVASVKAELDHEASPARSLNPASEDGTTASASGTPSKETETRGTRSQAKLKRRAEALAARESPLKKKVAIQTEKWEPGDNCEVCGRDDDAKQMLLCDGCEEGYHIFCLDPPLNSIPKVDWYCAKCLVGRGDFGFEDGGVYSLAEFQHKANEWKRQYFAKQQSTNPDRHISADSEDDVEREFWRLVQDVNDDTQVEYGADIHVTTAGSAFPTLEKEPLDRYSADPWNLNNIALLNDSLLRYINTNVSGMIVPWLYVGMCFSTFCWHNEDHYTYSVNYQHFGETKTWYGIPASDAEKFEEVMRKAVPELFEQQPDLLLQLVTIFSPQRLVDEGVQVYGCNQHANEFVITFPQAYHAGFNQGFNFNEAVNFATPDWMIEGFAKSCVVRYKQFSRQPVFSHDELLLNALRHDNSIAAAMWLAPAMTEMYEREMQLRKDVRQRYPGMAEIVSEQDMPEEGYTCGHCKSFSYLSQVACKCTSKVTCPEHAQDLCDCADDQRYLRLRYSDTDLLKLERKVNDRARQPDLWREKLETTMAEGPRPPIKALRSLVAEGEKIPYPIAEVKTLRQFVNRANAWIDEANAFISKKSANVGRRKSEKLKTLLSSGEVDDKIAKTEPAVKRQPEYVMQLLLDARKLAFSSPEIDALSQKQAAILAWREEAQRLMKLPQIAIEHCIQLIESGQELNVDIPEIRQFVTYVSQLNWLERARPSFEKIISLEEVTKMWNDGEACGVPAQSLEMHNLLLRRTEGENWELVAQKLLGADKVSLGAVADHLEQIQRKRICASTPTVAKLNALLDKGGNIQREVRQLLSRAESESHAARPTMQEARNLMTKLEGVPVKPAEAEKLPLLVGKGVDWLKRAKRIFGKANAPQDVLNQHLDHVIRHNEAVFSLDDVYRDPVEPQSRDNSPERVQQDDDARPGVFCICRQSEAGLMLECDVCREWYHGKCLKISKKDVNDDDNSYVCPVCDWRQEIPRPSNRPLLEDMQALERDALELPFIVAELAKVRSIVATAQAFRDRLQPFFATYISFTFAELPTLRFYLRKLEGGEVLLAAETNHFRAKVHELYPIAPTAPPIVSESKSTRKPRMSKKKREELIAQGIDPATWKPPESSSPAIAVPQPTLEPQGDEQHSMQDLPHGVAMETPQVFKTETTAYGGTSALNEPAIDSKSLKSSPTPASGNGTPSIELPAAQRPQALGSIVEPQATGVPVAGTSPYAVEAEVGEVFDTTAYTAPSGFHHDPDIAATLTGLRHTADNPFASSQHHVDAGRGTALDTELSAAFDDGHHGQQTDLLSSALKVGSDELRDFAASAHVDVATHNDSNAQLDEDGDFDMYLA